MLRSKFALITRSLLMLTVACAVIAGSALQSSALLVTAEFTEQWFDTTPVSDTNTDNEADLFSITLSGSDPGDAGIFITGATFSFDQSASPVYLDVDGTSVVNPGFGASFGFSGTSGGASATPVDGATSLAVSFAPGLNVLGDAVGAFSIDLDNSNAVVRGHPVGGTNSDMIDTIVTLTVDNNGTPQTHVLTFDTSSSALPGFASGSLSITAVPEASVIAVWSLLTLGVCTYRRRKASQVS